MKDAGRMWVSFVLFRPPRSFFFAHNKLVDNAVSMPHRLLVPHHVTTHPPPLAPAVSRTTSKSTEAAYTPHAASSHPLSAHEQPRKRCGGGVWGIRHLLVLSSLMIEPEMTRSQ